MSKPKAFPGYPPRCLRTLALTLAAGMVYPGLVLLSTLTDVSAPYSAAAMYWGLIKLGFAYAVLCLYQAQRKRKVALAGMLLFVSGLFSFFPADPFLVYGVEALAITALSLVLYDFGKTFPRSRMEVPAGLIFLGVIASILNTESTAWIGLLLLLIGMGMASRRLRAGY